MARIFSYAAIVSLALGVAANAQPPGGTGLPSDPQPNPIESVAMDMTDVTRDLAKLETGKPTQAKQDAVVAKLDELIKQLEKECEGCRQCGRSGRNPRKPALASTLRTGPGGMGDLHGFRKENEKFGNLKAHERDKILQSMSEGFPPEERAALERFYRLLAEEKTATGDDPSGKKPAKSAAKPAAKPGAKPTPPVKS